MYKRLTLSVDFGFIKFPLKPATSEVTKHSRCLLTVNSYNVPIENAYLVYIANKVLRLIISN